MPEEITVPDESNVVRKLIESAELTRLEFETNKGRPLEGTGPSIEDRIEMLNVAMALGHAAVLLPEDLEIRLHRISSC